MNPTPTPKIAHWGLKKSKTTQKLTQNQKSKFEGHIENKSCSATWLYNKIVFDPYHDPKNSSLGLQKFKNYPKNESKTKVKN